jgi:CheY-like chemotaxis protein
MKEPVILVVEDLDEDVFLLRRALAAVRFQGEVKVVQNPAQARDYLDGAGQFKDRDYYPSPDLIICDLKMPGGTGVEFVQWLHTQPGYRQIPVVLFSGSALPSDQEAAIRHGARAFFTKTGEFAVLQERVQQILAYLPQAFTSVRMEPVAEMFGAGR